MSEEEHDPDERLQSAMANFRQRLQEEGLKSTRQRDVIVERFFALDEHISADEMLEEVRATQPTIGYATVYRTLKLLVELDLAITKNFGDGSTRYDPIFDQDPQHDHLICVDCRNIIEFADEGISSQLDALAERMGYHLTRKKLELYAEGRIENCPNRSSD